MDKNFLEVDKTEYDEKKVPKFLSNKISNYKKKVLFERKGLDRLELKAEIYYNYLLLGQWLDEEISKLEKELSECNTEIYFPKINRVVITRNIGESEKVTFVEEISKSQKKRAVKYEISKELKNRNLVKESYTD